MVDTHAMVTFDQIGVDPEFTHGLLGHVHWNRCYNGRTVGGRTVVGFFLANALLTVMSTVADGIRDLPGHADALVKAEADVKRMDMRPRRHAAAGPYEPPANA